MNGFHAEIEGAPLSPFRRALLSVENGTGFFAVERRGTKDFEPAYPDKNYLRKYVESVENWKVDPDRLKRLRENGLITGEQADRFTDQGALGSHLENIERREGYKGFNKKNVSTIIKATDPRKY